MARQILGRRQLAQQFIFSLSFAILAVASGPARATTAGGAIQGTLYDPSGAAVTNPSVNFKIQIIDPSGACVLYEELHPALDLALTKGDFSFNLGYGTSAHNFVTSGTVLDENVFRNDANLAASVACPSGVVFASGDPRLVHVQFDVGAGYTALAPDLIVQGGAYAAVAQTLQGRTPASFLAVVDDGTTALNQSNTANVFSVVNYAKLLALLAGTSNLYQVTSPTAAVNENGQRLVNIGAPTSATDATTRGYVDANIGGKLLDVSAVGTASGNGSTLIWSSSLNKWVAGSLAISGTAGGDLTGAYPSPTIANNSITAAKINNIGGGINRLLMTDNVLGNTITYAVCTPNQVMAWKATGWACADPLAFPLLASPTGTVTTPAYGFQGNPGTGMYSPGVGTTAFSSMGTTSLVIDGNGNMGLGAQSFDNRLVIGATPNTFSRTAIQLGESGVGTPSADGDYSAGDKFIMWEGVPLAVVKNSIGNDSYGLWLQSSGSVFSHVSIWTGPTSGTAPFERLRVDQNGNLGIGTTAPQALLTVNGHQHFSGTAPTLTACGTGASVAGTDSAGRITVGTAPSTTCTFTFAANWTHAPICFAQDETTTNVFQRVTSVTSSAVTFKFASTLVANDKISFTCVGYQ